MVKRFGAFLVALVLVFVGVACDPGVVLGTDDGGDVNPNPVTKDRASSGGNLLADGSFEGGSVGPWSADGGDVPTVSSAASLDGTKSLIIDPVGAKLDLSGIVKAGKRYSISMYVKYDGVLSRSTSSTLVFNSSSKTETLWNGYHTVGSLPFSPDYWPRINAVIDLSKVSSVSNASLKLSLSAVASDAVIYVDDVVVSELVENNPFPSNKTFAGTIKPDISESTMNSDITSLYDKWKEKYLRRVRFENGALQKDFQGYLVIGEANGNMSWASGWTADDYGISTSEAHGYGMLMMTLMAGYDNEAKYIFDRMYQVYVNSPSATNKDLMGWAFRQDYDLSATRVLTSATDGDMDVAYALLMANDQWGGGPDHISGVSISYYDAAVKIINALEASCIYTDEGPHFPRLGDSDDVWGKNYNHRLTRSSDFLVGHCELFAEVTGKTIWTEVATTMINISEDMQAEHNNGLMPDFMWNDKGDWGSKVKTQNPGISDEGTDHLFSWNACRYPFRIGAAYIHGYRQAETKKILDRLSGWANTDPSKIMGGYNLDGTATESYSSTAFSAPLTTALAASSDQTKITAYWNYIKAFEPETQWTTNYFQNSIKLLVMNMISGNWYKPSTRANP